MRNWIQCLFYGAMLFSAMLMAQTHTNPILFVTQLPIPDEWMTISQTFGNHLGSPNKVGRGGDLWIRYPDGTLRNLTEAAGYGNSGFQGSGSIAVRDPHVHWDGTKAVFSMVIGAAEQQYVYNDYFWQLYEISGLGINDTPQISKVPNQPENFNNINPAYGSDERIIFASDRPRNGAAHLYPQLDEYESAPTVTGLWSLDPASGDLFILNHSPSGSFRPFVDSYGRIIYTRWDHLQRDQQNDAGTYGAYNWSGEGINAVQTTANTEYFPESRYANGNLNGHTFELFFPWQINEDGTEEEILNHIGRHELSGYFSRSFTDDPNLDDFYIPTFNPNRIQNMFQISEDPTQAGIYYGIDSPTFYHHSAGRIIRLNGGEAVNPDSMLVSFLTDEVSNAGHFRSPRMLTDGTMISSYTAYSGATTNLGNRSFPRSPFRFRLMMLSESGGIQLPTEPLTNGIYKAVNFWDPDVMVTYPDSIPMWEFDPVEVVPRQRPAYRHTEIAAPEQQIFSEENINVASLKSFLTQNNLALVISRNMTTRDGADTQQPYNLRVANTNTQTIGSSGKIYDIAHLQFFQGDQLRAYSSYSSGRRVLAVPMHDDEHNLPNPEGPEGSVKIGSDGSMAAFVPARRALSWQLTDTTGNGIVRERYWVTFQPGEIRTCAGCHGVNTADQAGNLAAENPPEALRDLMQHYQSITGITDGDTQATLSRDIHLLGNYPNPFNPTTTIEYQLAASHPITLKIYDTLGRDIRTLVNQRQNPGAYQVVWDGKDDAGRAVSSGVYFYQLNSEHLKQTRQMLLIR